MIETIELTIGDIEIEDTDDDDIEEDVDSYLPTGAQAYMHSIAKIPVLTFEEEQELGKAIAEGDEGAKKKLIECNLKLVVSIVKRYISRTSIPFLDLVQEGKVGLMTAVAQFDYTKGYKFSTYAYWWIKQAVSKAIAIQSRTIRIPIHIIEGLSKINTASRILFQELKREPTAEELAERTGLDIKKVNEYRAIVKEPTSLDVSIDDDGEATVGDLVADEEVDPLEKLYKEEMGQNIQKVLSTLDDKERDVLTMRFGLDGSRPKTLDEVGQIYSLSKERIRQIEAKALTKLRHPVRARLLQDCLEV